MTPPVFRRTLIAGFAVLSGAACSATLPVRALPKGESRIIASFGGPVLPQGSPTFVIPYATVGAMRGLTDNTTLVYDLHVLMAALGVAGVDVGAAHRLRSQAGGMPEITALGQAYVFAGAGGARVYPHATLNASWRRGERQLVYVGIDAIAQFEGAPAALVAPLVGWQFPVGRHLALQTEFKWMGANAFTQHGIFKGESSIGGHGALAFQLGAQWAR